jgi:SAM-dependent methyltransferase
MPKAMQQMTQRLARWAAGIPEERRFWDGWIASRGGQWPEDFSWRMNPAAPLWPFPAQVAATLGQPALRLLDVGAGPITSLGGVLPGVALEVTAVDPLAPLYAALLARHGVVPPIPTRFATMEELLLFFPARQFDLVHCRNALDHAADPLLGIRQMLAVTRPGGVVALDHFPNEGEREGYGGFHQWNLDLRDGRFVLWTPAETVDVATALDCPCTIEAVQGATLLVTLRKTAEAPPPPLPAGLTAVALEAMVRDLIAAAPAPG